MIMIKIIYAKPTVGSLIMLKKKQAFFLTNYKLLCSSRAKYDRNHLPCPKNVSNAESYENLLKILLYCAIIIVSY